MVRFLFLFATGTVGGGGGGVRTNPTKPSSVRAWFNILSLAQEIEIPCKDVYSLCSQIPPIPLPHPTPSRNSLCS